MRVKITVKRGVFTKIKNKSKETDPSIYMNQNKIIIYDSVNSPFRLDTITIDSNSMTDPTTMIPPGKYKAVIEITNGSISCASLKMIKNKQLPDLDNPFLSYIQEKSVTIQYRNDIECEVAIHDFGNMRSADVLNTLNENYANMRLVSGPELRNNTSTTLVMSPIPSSQISSPLPSNVSPINYVNTGTPPSTSRTLIYPDSGIRSTYQSTPMRSDRYM